MRCLYEVLGVEQDAGDAVIKKAYRKLALEWHPDKNGHRADEAQERFQELQAAWEILSNPQERSWYNSHREQILRAGGLAGAAASDDGPAENPYSDISLDAYCAKAAFKGFEGPTGFYVVFAELFRTLADEEQRAYRAQKPIDKKLKKPAEAPTFGDADAADADVRGFYAHWRNFNTVKDFAWLDEYNTSSAPTRGIRRLMEQINDKARRAGRKHFIESVRTVAEAAHAQDPRVTDIQVRAEEEKAARAEAAELKRAAEAEVRNAAAAAYQDAEWIREGEEEQLARLDAEHAPAAPTEHGVHECVVCDKTYKTEKALRNHEASKKHKEALRKFKKVMHAEDTLGVEDLSVA